MGAVRRRSDRKMVNDLNPEVLWTVQRWTG
jgi:hypothetical protein